MKKITTNTTPANTPPKKKYTMLKFIAIMVISMLVGAVVGGTMAAFLDNTDTASAALLSWLAAVLPTVHWVVFALLTVVSFGLYFAARTVVFAFERSGSENEKLSERADTLITFSMLANSLNMIFVYCIFGMLCALPMVLNLENSINVLVLFATIIVTTAHNVYSIKLYKRLAPEKRGDPLDFKFGKEWIDSCDEAEKMLIYKASYSTYKLMQVVLLAVWVLTAILGPFFDIGIYPMVIITIIWLAHTVGYQLSAIKLGKEKLNR